MANAPAQPRYPILAVSRLTGIGVDTLRAWERRYGAIRPLRDKRGRLYTDADVARLRLLNHAVSAGHGVGRIARLGDDELRRLVDTPPQAHISPAAPPIARFDPGPLDAALSTFDGAALDQELWRLAAVMPALDLVRDVLMPTLTRVGGRWNQEQGGIAHEHLMSAALRHLLGSFLRFYRRAERPPRLLFATPAGERHEIGVLAAAMLAASHGLSVAYLGPDLPASEIVTAARASGAQAIVLGLTLPGTLQPRDRELKRLVRLLPPGIELWAGGAGTASYADLLEGRALIVTDFDQYVVELARLAGRSS